MKRLIYLYIISILILAGCDSAKINPKTANISFGAEIEYYDKLYSAEFEVLKNGTATVNVKKPDKISGLTLLTDGNNVKLGFSDLEYTYDISENKILSPYTILLNILKISADTEIKTENDTFFSVIKLNGNTYTVFFGGSGLPINIKDKNGNYNVNFKNIRILNEKEP